MHASKQLEIVGEIEHVRLTSLDLELCCRIDTGARSSALHVFDLREHEPDFVSFVVRGSRDGELVDVHAEARVRRWAEVRSPTGGIEVRPFVLIRAALSERSLPIEIGLTARDGMRYPMLLGRSAIEGRYLVDVARRFVQRGRGRTP